jgi:hypothetical protein
MGTLALLVLGLSVRAQDFSLDWFTWDAGSETSFGGAYALTGTIGQPDAGAMSGGDYALIGGFWAVPPPGLEADVSPRSGLGNGSVSVTDWVQIGRFVAGLDAALVGLEFQRADCAPRAGFGDGKLTVTDWVQAGRYAAGLDPATPEAGPTAPVTSSAAALRTLPVQLVKQGTMQRTVTWTLRPGPSGSVTELVVTLNGVGGENALGFSLGFDPRRWRYCGSVLAAGAQGTTLLVNARGADAGRVGIALALSPGEVFGAGWKDLLMVQFAALGDPSPGPLVRFMSEPIGFEVVSAEAEALPAAWGNGTSDAATEVWPEAGLRLSLSGSGQLTVAWPLTLVGGILETSTSVGPEAVWSPVTRLAREIEISNTVSIEATGSTRFYRLRRE